MDFAPAVERWRSLVSQYVPAQYVDKVLWVINYESGGDPNAVGDNGVAIGLLQIQNSSAFAGRPSTEQLLDPSYNIQYAASQLGINSGNFGAWGEGTSYNGTKFGALGNHPFPTDTGTASAGNSGAGATASAPTAVPAGSYLADLPGPLKPLGTLIDGAGIVIGTVVDAGGKIVSLIPGGHYIVDAEGKVFDTTGQQIGKVSGATAGAVGGVAGNILGPLTDLLTKLPDVLAGTFTALKWLLDPHHWFRLFFIGAGGVMVVTGAYMYVRGDKVTSDIASATKGAEMAAV